MFLSVPHSIGKGPRGTIPCPVGPRNSGQLSAVDGEAIAKVPAIHVMRSRRIKGRCSWQRRLSRDDDGRAAVSLLPLTRPSWPRTSVAPPRLLGLGLAEVLQRTISCAGVI